MNTSNRWRAVHSNGRSVGRHEVELSLGSEGFELRHPDGTLTVWPYWSVRGTQQQGRILLETRSEPRETAEVADAAFAHELRAKFPALLEQGAGGRDTMLRAAAIGLGAIAAIGFLFWLASPLIGQWAAALVPRSVEEKLGEAVVTVMAPESKRCTDPEIERQMQQILDRLEEAAPSPYKLRLYVVDDKVVNAFAAPGGFIVLNRGLIEKTRTPEEIAGVLAHELQHVRLRHGTRALLRGLGIRIVLAALIGDASWLYDLTGALGELHFLRQDEDSADREGMRTIEAARLDPLGMVDLLKTLDQEAGDLPGSVKYLSTHPPTKDRITRMEEMARDARYTPRKLPVRGKWPPSLESCRPRA